LWKESKDNRRRIECEEIKVKKLQSKTGQKTLVGRIRKEGIKIPRKMK